MTAVLERSDDIDTAVPDPFPIVAVGASAGGLAPTVALLHELGPRPELALVVLHHLDPTHESGLVEVLSRATSLSVVAATDGARVEPNRVYVLPPNAGLRIQAGVLRLVDRVDTGGLHLPIDQFFESLAIDQESLAVGVVLSGTGFDGAHGVKAIKAGGGIALAQDSTAQQTSMPESAIATGCVDFVLPPAGLARELVRVGIDAPSVLETLRSRESLLEDAASRSHQRSVRPHVTPDGRIDGAVVSARDLDAEKRSAEHLTRAKKYAEGIIGTVRDGLVALDRDGRVQTANKAFLHAFELTPSEVDARRLDELGRAELATPALEKLLDAADGADELRLERNDALGRARAFVVSARRIEDTELVLLAFAEVTESERAAKEIRAYQDDLQRMSFEAAVAEERERRRLAAEVHDRIGQSLAVAQIKLTAVRGELVGEARVAVDAAVALLEQAIADKRALIFDLSPPILYDLGLGDALAWLAEDCERRYGITLEVFDDGSNTPMSDSVKAIVFRTVRELVMNVLKHAGVTTAIVSLRRIDDELEVVVEDRGVGFDVDAPAGRAQRGAFGLLSARGQIARIGGALTIEAAPGEGTRARLRVPLRRMDDPSRGPARTA